MSRFFAALACALALACSALPALADTTGLIRGTVTHDGHAVPHVLVHLYGDRYAAQTTTDDAGKFTFARVPFGSYHLHASVDNNPAVADIDIGSDEVVSVVLEPVSSAKVIGRTSGSSRTVRGTPVSENAILADQIATLPRGDSLVGLVESVPGIVRFSYDEPVAHGFHGLTYELDGAPLPQSTSSNFSDLVDPRSIQSLEVFTGAFPAEYGGARQGALVNLVSHTPQLGTPQGTITLGAGSFGSSEARLAENFSIGKTAFTFSANSSGTNRALDTPAQAIEHDAGSLSDQFLRAVTDLGNGNQLAFNVTNQNATYQIPINTNPNDPNNPYVSAPGTDDVQLEQSHSVSASFTHVSKDGLGFLQVVPWVQYQRVAYLGDIPNDLLATYPDPDTGLPDFQNGLQQDRRATYLGLRSSVSRSSDFHSVKAGFDVSRETYSDNGFIALANNGGNLSDTVAQTGTQFGAYIQDRWAIGQQLAINYGIRYDHSTGFVSGSQVSPRFEVNYSPDRITVFHFYAGQLYAAPALEDTRQDAIVTQSSSTTTPVYDLKPEHDGYVEGGIAHTFHPGLTAYANLWERNAINVLDTTQLLNTPIFAVYNNAIGHAHGVEFRLQDTTPIDSAYVSATFSNSLAGGISGSTFLFDPSTVSDLTLNPEDHDQAVAINAAYTHRFGAAAAYYATLAPEFGTGYPTTFQDGSNGRLPAHWVVNLALGRNASHGPNQLGYQLAVENLFNNQYLIKVNNGFNTTQWSATRRVTFRVIAPF